MRQARRPGGGPGRAAPAGRRAPERQRARQERILRVAMEHFATHGYEAARIEEIASQAGVSKGAVFGYFETKAGLFLAAYQAAARSFPAYLDAPPAICAGGFFTILRYWIGRTPHLIHEDWIPYRVTLIGNYCAGLQLRREITQFMAREDPYGTEAFVRSGIAGGEIREDIDQRMIVSMVDWLMDRVQDAMVTEELDPGLFGSASSPEQRDLRVNEFIELLRSAVAAPAGPPGRLAGGPAPGPAS